MDDFLLSQQSNCCLKHDSCPSTAYCGELFWAAACGIAFYLFGSIIVDEAEILQTSRGSIPVPG